MEKSILKSGEAPRIIVVEVGAGVRITGHPESEIQAIASEPEVLSQVKGKDRFELRCESECSLFVPHSASIEVKHVGGGARIVGVSGDLLIKTIGANLQVRNVGPTVIESVGGDLQASKVAGALSVDRCGGDAQVEQIEGDTRLRRVGGDLIAVDLAGLLEADIGGDANVVLAPPPGSESRLHAGGELVCRLPAEISAQIRLSAGGDVRFAISEEAQVTPDGFEVKLGQGEAKVRLQAGGDLVLRTGDDSLEGMGMDLGEAIVARVAAEMEAEMAEIEARISELGAGLEHFDSEQISQKVRTSIARAQRKAEHARRRATRRARRRTEDRERRPAPFGVPIQPPDSTEEERRMILNMIEAGKISVEEAEKLFEALEG